MSTIGKICHLTIQHFLFFKKAKSRNVCTGVPVSLDIQSGYLSIILICKQYSGYDFIPETGVTNTLLSKLSFINMTSVLNYIVVKIRGQLNL